MKQKIFLLFGPPGSGKGTIGAILGQLGRCHHLSSGDVFRALDRTSPIGQKAGALIDKGELVPDDIVMEVIRTHIETQLPDNQGVLMDGVPRTVAQVDLLAEWAEVERVIQFKIREPEVLIERIAGRAREEGRADDANPEILRRRLQIYEEETAQVIKRYPEAKILPINAQQSKLEVLRDVLDALATEL